MTSSDVWFSLLSNGSMASFLARWGVDRWVGTAIAVFSSAAFITWARRRQSERLLKDPVIWVALALLLLPLSWVSYDIVLIVGLVGGMWSPVREHRTINLSIWGVWIGMSIAMLLSGGLAPDQAVDMGVPTFAVRVILIFAWAVAAIGWNGSPWRPDDHARLNESGADREGFSPSRALS